MRTYTTSVKISEPMRLILADKRAASELLAAIAEDKMPVTIVLGGKEYTIDRRPRQILEKP